MSKSSCNNQSSSYPRSPGQQDRNSLNQCRHGSDSSSCPSSPEYRSSHSSSPHLSQVLVGTLESAEAAVEAVSSRSPEVYHETNIDDYDSCSKNDVDQKYNNITDEQIAIIKNLSELQLFKVIDCLCRNVSIDKVLVQTAPNVVNVVKKAKDEAEADTNEMTESEVAAAVSEANIITNRSSDHLCPDYYLQISSYVPLRLTYEERRFLRILESTLEVSEYTDKIDILCGGNKARRIAREIRQVCAILSGLAIAHNYEEGQRVFRDHDMASHASFFQTIFEIGRRYKVLNPECMRSAYGKLMYLLMDAKKEEIQQLLNFDCVRPIHTVHSLLSSKKNGLELLSDPLVSVATMEIHPEGKSRVQVQREINQKQNAIKTLAKKYATRDTKPSTGFFGLRLSFFQRGGGGDGSSSEDNESEDGDSLTVDEIEQCLYSLGDHNTYLRFNRLPCERILQFLCQYFHPVEPEEGYSLAISCGKAGSRLSHSHGRQYLYVLQSLTLWKEVATEMFVLWRMAEQDMLQRGNNYRLRDTGQGLNRVQDCPRVSNAMRLILQRVQQQTSGWVGSSVVHLGDHNVPNALIFIDKYTQIPRILSPLVLCLDKLPNLYETKPALKNYFDEQFGGLHSLRKLILCDFFRHAFDGSGADNFFDAGSCIDGRLTSAWNWCSAVEKKAYFPSLLLTGFTGFDGKF